MTITLLLLFLPSLIASYNLELNNVMIYEAPSLNSKSNQRSSSLFGYSVLLSSKKHILSNGSSVQESWMLVGAPKENYAKQPNQGNNEISEEPGVTYRCPLPHECLPINVTDPDDEVGFIEQVKRTILIKKGHGWFGASMSLHQPTESLTVCAPRTIVRIYSSSTSHYENTMQGVCYNGIISSGNLYRGDKNFSSYDFGSPFWYNPLNGFAVHYPTPQAKMQPDSIDPIIGSPKHELYGSVRKMKQYRITELPIGDDLSQFGYSLTSGYYFHEEQLMVAAGAPGWQYVGQVAIMDPRGDPLSIIATINGKEVGEYFGASLATGDINNDGLDDLIVGAPHWNNDNGRVHIFLGNKAGFFEADILLEGSVDDALYGYAVTSGDLDGDGFDDLIIGAPWEDSGVIYVYNGDVKFEEFHLFEPSQRISASGIDKNILRFGFSLSKPLDIDGNGLLDIAVGAYASGHAVILRSRPTVKTKITVSTIPKALPRNATSFVLKLCVDHYPHDKKTNQMWDNILRVVVDEDYKRVYTFYTIVRFLRESPGSCISTDFKLKENIRNYVDVIQIFVYHEFWYLSKFDVCAKNIIMGSLCPIEYKARNVTAQSKLSFDIGCGMDDICQAFIFTKLEFQGIRNSTWIIGSDDLSLVLRIGNHAEPAYLTTVTFNIPKGINLRSILPSCQEEGDSEALSVTCDVGNPLGTAMEKIMILDLDMNGMRNGSADGTVQNFTVEIKTRSVNRGASRIAIPLHLKANVSVALSGKAYDNSYYLKYNEKPKNFTFQHSYQISRFGATPISVAYLTIRIPYKLKGLEFLTIVHKPRVSILGRFHECSVNGVSIAKPRSVDKLPIKIKINNDFHLDTIANHSRSRRTSSLYQKKLTAVPKTDSISHTMLTNFIQWESTKNPQPQFYTIAESENVDIHYFNCSTENVTCGQVVCKISSLKTSQDVAKLQIQLVVNDSMLIGDADENEKVIHITTEASVEVLDPKMQFVVPGAEIFVPVTTTIYHAPNVTKEISIWIILGSVLLGLLTLCFIAIALWQIGFFKRNKKEELNSLKKSEDISMHSDPFTEEGNEVHNVFI